MVDHDTGRLVWAGNGRNSATLRVFFDLLGPERSAQLTHVSADGAEWIHDVVAERAPTAVLCLDAFYDDVLVMPMWGWCGCVTSADTNVGSAYQRFCRKVSSWSEAGW